MSTRAIKMKFKESELPDTMRIKVVHLHPGNSSKRQRKGCVYRTLAKILEKDSDRILGRGEARCNPLDTPSRRVGRDIAVGRALKTALEDMGLKEGGVEKQNNKMRIPDLSKGENYELSA